MKTFALFAPLVVLLFGCAEPTPARFNLEVEPPRWAKETDTETEIGSVGFSRAVIGGLQIQQMAAETSARAKLSDRVYTIALNAANEIFTKETDRNLARDTALMVVSLADDDFYRAAIAWSPAQDYFTLFRVSFETLRGALETALNWSIREAKDDHSGTVFDYDKLRVQKVIDRAIDAAKKGEI